MRIQNSIEPIKLCEHISDLIVEPIRKEQKTTNKKIKKKIDKEAKNNLIFYKIFIIFIIILDWINNNEEINKKNYWNQNIIKSFLSECDNRKDNKIVFLNDDDTKEKK